MVVTKKDNNYLYKKINSCETVSFDVFDTLITRMVNKPEDIFDIVEKRYNNIHSNNKIYNFKKNRIEAEARIKKSVPTIIEIYDFLEEKYDTDVTKQLMKIEIEMEYSMCVPVMDIKKIYDYCVVNRKRIIAVSDMYLSCAHIKRMLNKCGYDNISEIIVSCEFRKSKHSGELFHISKEKSMIHIGDSWRADFLGAIKGKICPIHIRKVHFNGFGTNIAKIQERLHGEQYFENIGSCVVGPLLVAFSYWLDACLEETNMHKVYFLSREGKIIKNVFDELFGNKYETKYLYVSRRVLTVTCYSRYRINNLNDLLEYFTIKKGSTVKDVVEYLGLDISPISSLYVETNIYDLIDNDFIFNTLNTQLMNLSPKEALLTEAYFMQENMTGSIAIVDIGWRGTMQKLLNVFFKGLHNNVQIKGYYIELFKHSNDMYSFITENAAVYSSVYDNPLLMENLLQSDEGSTIGYKKCCNTILPIKRDCEFDRIAISNLAQIKCGTENYVRYWKKYGYCKNYVALREEALSIVNRFICNPKKSDIDNFKDFNYSDIRVNRIIPEKNLKNIISDFYKAAWKYAYIKQFTGTNLYNKAIIKVLKRRGQI